jgi:hypothetical protein
VWPGFSRQEYRWLVGQEGPQSRREQLRVRSALRRLVGWRPGALDRWQAAPWQDKQSRQWTIAAIAGDLRDSRDPYVRPGSKSASGWLLQPLERKPRKLVAMALANKMARIIWAMMNPALICRSIVWMSFAEPIWASGHATAHQDTWPQQGAQQPLGLLGIIQFPSVALRCAHRGKQILGSRAGHKAMKHSVVGADAISTADLTI